MRAVGLYRRTPAAETEYVGRVVVRATGGPAELELPDETFREGMDLIMAMGELDAAGRRRFPDEGEVFLDALLHSNRGSRWWARELVVDDA
jgi:hypothetical protein